MRTAQGFFEKLDRSLSGGSAVRHRTAEAYDERERLREIAVLPIGINVESVSIRKSEVDASVELYRRLSSRLAA